MKICKTCNRTIHPEAKTCLVCRSVWTNRYRAKKLQVLSTLTAADIWQKYDVQGGTCFYCECDLPNNGAFSVDHLLPMSQGGANTPANIAVTCWNCNIRKGGKTVENFKAELRGEWLPVSKRKTMRAKS